jgi:uncharacterized protein YxeA
MKKMIFSITALMLLIFTIVAILFSYNDHNTFEIKIVPNVKEKQFAVFVEKLKELTKSDDHKLYKVSDFMIQFEKNGDLKEFYLDFAVIRNGKAIHYQTQDYKENLGKVVFDRAFDITLDHVDEEKDFGDTITKIDRIPWDHFESIYSTKEFDHIGLTSKVTFDEQGNIRLDSVPTENSFEVNRDGKVSAFHNQFSVPIKRYDVLSFLFVKENHGSLDISYFFQRTP